MGLIRGLANEWAHYGIRVNGIAPGIIPTDLNRPLIEGTPRGNGSRNTRPWQDSAKPTSWSAPPST